MAFHNNIISFDGNKALESRFALKEEYRGIADNCRQIILKTFPKQVDEMFEKLDDALYELADKADSNHMQSAYFDAMREVRKEREGIENGFNGSILNGYDNFWRNGPAAAKPAASAGDSEANDFSLMENADLEESLAVNNMISRGENRYYRDLYALDQRLGYLAGGMTVDRISNPLAPAAICDAFYGATRGLGLEIPVMLVIYKNFEHIVVDALGSFYEQLNKQLAEAGVLPKLSRKVRRSKSYFAPPVAAAPQQMPGLEREDYGSDDEVSGLQAELFSTLQQLLMHRRGAISPTMAVREASMPVVETGELLSALSALQQSSMMAPPESGYQGQLIPDVRAGIRQAMQVAQGAAADKKIAQNDEDAIDVISMLFEFILEDRNLPDAMKALLARLQIPMLKVAILDKTFFSRKKHPARRLLNNLAQAAVGWSETNGRGEGGLYARIESIIERILTGFDSDGDIFIELNDEFIEFMENEERGSKVTEQRVAQITIGKEQLQTARHEVFQQINDRLLGRDDVPQVVITLIREGWKDVLLLICLRKGIDSPDWQQALELMDRLLWSVEAKPEPAQRQDLLKEIPVLLKKLRSGLNDISYDQHKMARLFKDLQACHVDSLKGGGSKCVADAAAAGHMARHDSGEGIQRRRDGEGVTAHNRQIDEAPPAVGEEIVLQTPSADAAAAEPQRDRHLEIAEQLQIGTWLEVTDEEGGKYRAKLSWRSKVSGTCLFVNRKGMKVAEVSLQGLATWFRGEKAVILDQAGVPLMDRALKAMVHVLKNTGDH